MPSSRTYSAGTAFLTVVPSFLGIEQAFKQQVRDMAAAADKDLAAGVAKGLADANKGAKDQGAKGGKDFAGAYETEAKKALTKAYQSLPEPQPGVDLRKWDKALADVRQGMKDLSNQRIGIDIDQPTFDAAIAAFKKDLEELRDSAGGQNKDIGFFNADSAAKELDNLKRFTDQAAQIAGDGGEAAGSAFNERLSKALEGSISKIPDIKIDADSSDAERKISELRDRMLELQSKKIGIDIDAGTAYAEIKAIKDELDALDRKDTRIDIRTNARDASAEFNQLTTAAEGSAAGVEDIGTKSQFSLSRLEYLIALGASLGTVLVPAAAAAAGAVGFVGTAALASVSGIGVFALAISGVSDAVKALNTYQGDQAKSSKSVDDANRSVATSTDQVKSATMALANTRRTVAQAAEDAAKRVQEAEQGVADARRQAASEAKSAAQAVSDARRSEKDSEADLADAKRQAVLDEAEAERQVKDAQRDLTDAEKNALDVRKALTQAIDDAKDSMAELDVELKRNQQDQSVAVTAQMKALDDLNKLRTNPRATQVELRQAEDAYNEQTVRIEELQVKNKELAEQKSKYDKQGVEGDDAVIAARKRIADADQAVADARDKLSREQAQRDEADYKAQKKVADAQEAVAKAQQQVARAQESQRDSQIRGQESIAKAEAQVATAREAQSRQAQDAQYQLAQAAQAVTAAQRSQQAAWQKTATAGGDALDTLNQKMSELSPAQQHFAKFLFGLKDDLLQFRAAAAEPLLPQLETAITKLLQYLPGVNSFISKVADGLGHIAIEAVDSLGNPVWQRFFGYIDKTAVPTMQELFEAGSNVAQGLVNLFIALTPFNKPVGEGLVQLTQDFAEWAEKLDKTQGYRNFLQYVQENGPRVVKFLGGIGELLIDLVKAASPLGSVVLRVLEGLVDVLNSIPTPVLTGLVFAIGAVSLAFTALGGFMRALKLKKEITDIFGPAASKLVQKFAVDTGRATDETSNFGKATATVHGIAAAGRDKVAGYAKAVASLSGSYVDAAKGSVPLNKAIDALRSTAETAASAVSSTAGKIASATASAAQAGYNATKQKAQQLATLYSGPGGLSRALDDTQAAAQRAADAIARTATNAVTGTLSKTKTAVYEVATAYNGPAGLAGAIQAAGGKLQFLTGGVADASGKIGGLARSAADAATSFGGKIAGGAGKFAGALGSVAKAAGSAATAVGSKLVSAGGSLVSLMGGPWGLALTAASLAIGYFANKAAEQRAKVETLTATLGELSSTYRDLSLTGEQAGAAADKSFRDIVKNNPDMQKAVVTLSQLGVSFDDMVKAVGSGDPSAVIAKLNDEIKKTQDLEQQAEQRLAGQAAGRHVDEATAKAVSADKARIQSLTNLRDAFSQNAKVMGLAAQADDILSQGNERNTVVTTAQTNAVKTGTGVQIDLLNSYDRNADSITALNGLVSTYNNLQSTSQQRSDAVRAAIDNETSSTIKQTDANEDLAQKTLTLSDQVLQAKDAHDKNATSLSLSTQTGLRNRDALEQVASSIREMYLQDIAAGKPIADVTKAHNNRIAALKEEAKRLGLDKDQTNQLIQAYGEVPKDVKTAVSMDPNSFKNVYTNLQKLQFMQQMLKLGASEEEAEKGWKQSQNDMNRAIAHGYADGGRLVGPGNGTSDSFAVRVSNGEWVHKAAAVDYYGDSAMSAINNMQVPREMLSGYAAGGKIPRQRDEPMQKFAVGGKTLNVPIKVDVGQTFVPSAAYVRAHTPIPTEDGSFTTLSPDASVAKIQKFALAQRGKRYLWSAVGPDKYDCSGLVGNLWALATGHKLYHRYMSTADMGPGKHGMVAGPGKKMTIYLGPGHTAANVGGLHAEAYGGNGTPLAIGRIGTRLSYYNQKLHLPGFAEGGQIDTSDLKDPRERLISFLRTGWPEPPAGSGYENLLSAPLAGQFDGGGQLPPGLSTVLNDTGAPEPVLTSQQWKDISALAKQAMNGRGGNTYNYEFRDTTLTPGYLKAMQDREAILARAGLPV